MDLHEGFAQGAGDHFPDRGFILHDKDAFVHLGGPCEESDKAFQCTDVTRA